MHVCRRDYLIPLVLLLLHCKDRVDMAVQQLIRQLAHTGMVLRQTHTKLTVFQRNTLFIRQQQ